MITATAPFVLMLILLFKLLSLNNEVDGKGPSFYLGSEKIKIPVQNYSNFVLDEYDPNTEMGTLFQDAYS